eukprot:TRINITY_DN16036_c0_g1_i1.p1 TRINITY_DN16036_c0_g1~~TRINITY_DN16036_c0_g1_i1.p1  ORF type:complete len:211 (-),score=30.43 TRINITY_DN16036_c0_g1_i1:186-782(-)
MPGTTESARIFTPPGSPLSPRAKSDTSARKRSDSGSVDVHKVYNALLEEHGHKLDAHARHARSQSSLGRIMSLQHTGTIVYFCRIRGHGFIRPDQPTPSRSEESGNNTENGSNKSTQDIFLHISDIENDFVPGSGDRVSYQLLPMPPKFEKYQAVHARVIDITDAPHKFWSTPQTKEEIEKEKKLVHTEGATTPAADV